MKKIKPYLMVLLLSFMSSVMAADLTSAKAAGLIGEQHNGYIGLVTNVDEDVKQLVNEVNAKRKAIYQKLAEKQNLSVTEVESIAGKKAIEKTLKGNYIKRSGKDWEIK